MRSDWTYCCSHWKHSVQIHKSSDEQWAILTSPFEWEKLIMLLMTDFLYVKDKFHISFPHHNHPRGMLCLHVVFCINHVYSSKHVLCSCISGTGLSPHWLLHEPKCLIVWRAQSLLALNFNKILIIYLDCICVSCDSDCQFLLLRCLAWSLGWYLHTTPTQSSSKSKVTDSTQQLQLVRKTVFVNAFKTRSWFYLICAIFSNILTVFVFNRWQSLNVLTQKYFCQEHRRTKSSHLGKG